MTYEKLSEEVSKLLNDTEEKMNDLIARYNDHSIEGEIDGWSDGLHHQIPIHVRPTFGFELDLPRGTHIKHLFARAIHSILYCL